MCPFLVVFAFCWFIVKCFYNYLRDLGLKEALAEVYQQPEEVCKHLTFRYFREREMKLKMINEQLGGGI